MNEAQASARRKPRLLRGLTRNVIVLGLVSFFTDISSEMIVPIRILFLVFALNTPIPIAGLIEGIAESASSLIKVASGHLADHVPQRKPFIVAGYGISNLTKPLLAFVVVWQSALGLIVIDRIGKGLRASPRDAILADSAAPEYRGKVFGFHRSMDTLGAAVGPLLTFAILYFSSQSFQAVFLWTVVPGVIGLVVAIVFLREKREHVVNHQAAAIGVQRRRLSDLGPAFWAFTGIATIFGLGNSSDAFIFLRSAGLEGVMEAVPLAYFGYNVVYALLATPLGSLSDRFGRGRVLIGGYVAFGLVYDGWAYASQSWHVWALFLLYGVYAAATEGVAKAYVSDLIPRTQRGTGLGWYNGLTGLAALPANVAGGWLWTQYGPQTTFAVGGTVGMVAAGLLALFNEFVPRSRKPSPASME